MPSRPPPSKGQAAAIATVTTLALSSASSSWISGGSMQAHGFSPCRQNAPSRSRSTTTGRNMILFPGKGGIIVEPPSDGYIARDALLDDFMKRGAGTTSGTTFTYAPDDAQDAFPGPSQKNRPEPSEERHEQQQQQLNYNQNSMQEAADDIQSISSISSISSSSSTSQLEHTPQPETASPSIPQIDTVQVVGSSSYQHQQQLLSLLSAMKLKEIQVELQARGVSYADCFDRDSLSRRLLEAREAGGEIVGDLGGSVGVAGGGGANGMHNRGKAQPLHEWAHGPGRTAQPPQQSRREQQQPQSRSNPQYHQQQQQQHQQQHQQGREIGINDNSSTDNGPRHWWDA